MDGTRSFVIERCLGAGGFGEVYLARQRSPGGVESEVALKVLHEGLDPRSQAVQRLRDEGRLLGRLNHPHLLKVHDIVLLDGRVALAMEYIDGMDVEEAFTSHPRLGLRAGFEVAGRVADALHAAYSAVGPDGPLKLVHRDIKPPNIRLGKHGEVKVLDFGIAKAADTKREARTQTRVTLGSPWYMAPERFNHVADDPKSDVYALGCVLFEVASGGQRLFDTLSPREQFLLSLDEGRHQAHLDQFVKGRAFPGVVHETLDAMLAFDPASRPSCQLLAERLLDIADELEGPTLRKWVRQVTWPNPPSLQGALDGRVITEYPVSKYVTPEPESETQPESAPKPEPRSRPDSTLVLSSELDPDDVDADNLAVPETDLPSPKRRPRRSRSSWMGVMLVVMGMVALWGLVAVIGFGTITSLAILDEMADTGEPVDRASYLVGEARNHILTKTPIERDCGLRAITPEEREALEQALSPSERTTFRKLLRAELLP